MRSAASIAAARDVTRASAGGRDAVGAQHLLGLRFVERDRCRPSHAPAIARSERARSGAGACGSRVAPRARRSRSSRRATLAIARKAL